MFFSPAHIILETNTKQISVKEGQAVLRFCMFLKLDVIAHHLFFGRAVFILLFSPYLLVHFVKNIYDKCPVIKAKINI